MTIPVYAQSWVQRMAQRMVGCVCGALCGGVVIIESDRTNGGEEQSRGTFVFRFVMLLLLLQLETRLAWYVLHSRDISGTGR